MSDIIKKEDYAEPNCPLCIENLKRGTNITSIPVSRVFEKLDEYFSKNDYIGAERHLLYWKNEAELGFDERGKFSVLNELMGLYRKTGQKEKAFSAVDDTLKNIKALQNEESVSAATAYLNMATVFKAFGETQKSLELFKKATAIYENELKPDDERLGGLYNNFALTLVDLNQYESALSLYEKALGVMKNVPYGELEMAITHLNIADLYNKKDGAEKAEKEIEFNLTEAEKLLDTDNVPKNGYYAFVCEKCAPSFSFYGRFFFASELQKRAKEIYERS